MEYNVKKINEVEELEMLKSKVVREAGAVAGRHCKPGDIVKVSGDNKIELLVTDSAKPVSKKTK